MKNRYFIRSRITEKKFREIIKLFSSDLTAIQIAYLSGVSRMCVNRILKQLRRRISEECEKESLFKRGEIEMDESYFGARRVRGKKGRGAYGKTIVFGLKKRKGQVYTQVIRNCSKEQILALITSKIGKRTKVFMDGFKTYDSLVDLGYKKHYKVHHGKNEFAKKEKREKKKIKNHINGIENFCGIAKVRLYKFRGMDKTIFILDIKECEFRFNHRHDNLYLLLLKMCRNKPLKVS